VVEPFSTASLLGSARRREILRLVWRAERPAGEIHRALGDVTFGAVSQQLATLTAAGLVEVRREGRSRLYRARRQALGPLGAALERLWDDALYRLKLRAELAEGRRGPQRGLRPATVRKTRRRRRSRRPGGT
jgi:DNA-binding transcriptional ArsR family regulator